VFACAALRRGVVAWVSVKVAGRAPSRRQHGTAGCRETRPFCCDDVGRIQAFQAGASSAGAGAARRLIVCAWSHSALSAVQLQRPARSAIHSWNALSSSARRPPSIPQQRVCLHRRLRSANGTPNTCAPLGSRQAAPSRIPPSPSHPLRSSNPIGCVLLPSHHTISPPSPKTVASFISRDAGLRSSTQARALAGRTRCHRARPAPSRA
jgi:hypothetical protein